MDTDQPVLGNWCWFPSSPSAPCCAPILRGEGSWPTGSPGVSFNITSFLTLPWRSPSTLEVQSSSQTFFIAILLVFTRTQQPPVVKLVSALLCDLLVVPSCFPVPSLILISCQNSGLPINSFLTHFISHLFPSIVWMKSNLCLNADLVEHVF